MREEVLRPAFRAWLIRPRLLRQQLQPILDRLDAGISADAYVGDLTHFQRFLVELVKAIVAGCRLITLRDVSTFISDSELSRLHQILRRCAKEGISFLYLGFHYEELTRICDRTALFSNGRITKVLEHEAMTLPIIDSYDSMVRRQLHRQQGREERPPVLLVEGLSGGAVEGLSFSVAPGECVVLQDLQNRVFDELFGQCGHHPGPPSAGAVAQRPGAEGPAPGLRGGIGGRGVPASARAPVRPPEIRSGVPARPAPKPQSGVMCPALSGGGPGNAHPHLGAAGAAAEKGRGLGRPGHQPGRLPLPGLPAHPHPSGCVTGGVRAGGVCPYPIQRPPGWTCTDDSGPRRPAPVLLHPVRSPAVRRRGNLRRTAGGFEPGPAAISSKY